MNGLRKELQVMTATNDESKQKNQSLEVELEKSRRVLRNTNDELQDVKNVLKKTTKENSRINQENIEGPLARATCNNYSPRDVAWIT